MFEVLGLKIVSVVDVLLVDFDCFVGVIDYEMFVVGGDFDYVWMLFVDEWEVIVLNYMLGMIGDLKGVVYYYCGVYFVVISNIFEWDMLKYVVYLWMLLMFYCNGWCFLWVVVVCVGVNVCLCKFDVKIVFDLICCECIMYYCGVLIV